MLFSKFSGENFRAYTKLSARLEMLEQMLQKVQIAAVKIERIHTKDCIKIFFCKWQGLRCIHLKSGDTIRVTVCFILLIQKFRGRP